MFINQQYEIQESHEFWKVFVEFKYESPTCGWSTCFKTFV